jgi:aromatic-L-amino-acid/L-tryptophan decarboxylase
MGHVDINEFIERLLVKLHESTNDINSLNQWKMQMLALINKLAELKLAAFSSGVNTCHTSLDPVNWVSARRVAHQVLDSALDHVQYVRERPVWQPIPHDVHEAIAREPLPEHSQSLEKVCCDSLTYVMPYSLGNTHPRFWGWATGEGTLGGILADIIATSMNVNNVGGTHSAVVVEQTIIQWMRQIFGFPEGNVGGGVIVSGTSMATVVCVAVARHYAVENVKQDGLAGKPQLVAYASSEAHNCVVKAVELLGLGSKALRLIPVDDKFCIKTDELKMAIRADREQGLLPFCIIGNAGK